MGIQPLPKMGATLSPIFGPFLLWLNGWMHQDATWCGGRPPPRGLCVHWGPSLGPAAIVLDGDLAPPPRKGGEAPSPIFGACLLWPNGCVDQDDTWRGGGPWSRPHCARWGSSSPPEKGAEPSPMFGPFLMWSNGCMDQDITWYGGRPWPTRHCVRWKPSSPSPKGAQPPQFPLWPNGWMDYDATWYGGRPRTRQLCVGWGPRSPPEKKAHVPHTIFGPCLVAKRLDG